MTHAYHLQWFPKRNFLCEKDKPFGTKTPLWCSTIRRVVLHIQERHKSLKAVQDSLLLLCKSQSERERLESRTVLKNRVCVKERRRLGTNSSIWSNHESVTSIISHLVASSHPYSSDHLILGVRKERDKEFTTIKMDEILGSTSAELFPDEANADLSWLAMNQDHHDNVVSSSTHDNQWRHSSAIPDTTDLFSEDSSQGTIIKRPRKF